ncbi:MAG: sugar transferase [Anaerolineales bacterium]|nr:sugar transferase [Anaerolineales bacterium]MCB8983664.1 sugar transferase [Ardenticatenaceae bacterium]
MDEQELDERAAKMLAIYEKQAFNSARASQALRLRLVAWVLRAKLAQSVKRALDVIVASLALLVFSPVIGGTAVLIKLDSPGPIFFKQVRVGKWGRPFYVYKFRSMYIDAEERKAALMAQNEADGPVFKMKNDPRITRVGKYIRKFSVDELPQLLNVLKGEMSLVGPRPPVPKEVAEYEYEELGRLNAIPGITGLQQVSGRSDLDFKTWVELDLQYIAEQSFWKDIEILLKTIPAVVLGKGAY